MTLRLPEEAVELLHLVDRGCSPALRGDDGIDLFTEGRDKLGACGEVEERMCQALHD